jgi:transcriptional antiterminator RfaH
MPWYAIQTKPRKEPAVQSGLDRAGIEVYCPRLRTTPRRPRPRAVKETPLFPGYLFARFDFARDYPRVRWSPGLVRVVMSGGTPLPITEPMLDTVRRLEREGASPRRRAARLQPGTRVRVVGGPFTGFEGQVAATARGGERVRILLELFRRQASLECDPEVLRPLQAGCVR